MVAGSKVNVTLVVAIPIPYYHTKDCHLATVAYARLGILMIFFWMAYCTNCALLWMSSLRIRLNLCASTVFTLRLRSQAISFTELPSASSFRTSRSRVVNVAKRGRRLADLILDRKSSTNCES